MIPGIHAKSNLNVNASIGKSGVSIGHDSANQVAHMGIKIAALLLILEGQRPGCIAEVLGLTLQNLNLWIHKVNYEGLRALEPMKRPGLPARLTLKVQQELKKDLERVSFGIWVKSGLMGRSHVGGPSEASV